MNRARLLAPLLFAVLPACVADGGDAPADEDVDLAAQDKNALGKLDPKGALTIGAAKTGVLTEASGFHVYSYEGKAGDVVRFTETGWNVTPTLVVISPPADDHTWVFAGKPAPKGYVAMSILGGDGAQGIMLPVDGTYRIVATAKSNFAAGRNVIKNGKYELKVERAGIDASGSRYPVGINSTYARELQAAIAKATSKSFTCSFNAIAPSGKLVKADGLAYSLSQKAAGLGGPEQDSRRDYFVYFHSSGVVANPDKPGDTIDPNRSMIVGYISTVEPELQKLKTASGIAYDYSFHGSIFEDQLQVETTTAGAVTRVVYEKINNTGAIVMQIACTAK